jgi:protein SCO1/2
MRQRRPSILVLIAVTTTALAATALILAVTLGGSSERSSSPPPSSAAPSGVRAATSGFDGAALPATAPAHEFTLSDQAGRSVSLHEYQGQVTVLAFLYSTCGATCIVIAQQIRGALDELPHPVPVLFISADPGVDTSAHISRFLGQVSLTGRVHYLTGSLAALKPIWRAYGIVPATAGAAAFKRFASVFLLDGSGRERVVFQLEQLTPEALAHDIGKLAGG